MFFHRRSHPPQIILFSGGKQKGGFLWGLLGCCVPIAGLILFLVWKDQKPKTAKAAGIGALVCVIVGVIYYILMIVLGIGIASMGM